MRRLLAFILTLTLAACEGDDPASRSESRPPPLAEGTWVGGLKPMNHPDMQTPITYDVAYEGDDLVLALEGPDSSVMPARDVRLDGDTLRFTFDEPEEGVALECALGVTAEGAYEGRCTDASGKWARFSMHPPGEMHVPDGE